MLSKERLDPCRDGGLDPALEPVLDPGLEPPGVSVDLSILYNRFESTPYLLIDFRVEYKNSNIYNYNCFIIMLPILIKI